MRYITKAETRENDGKSRRCLWNMGHIARLKRGKLADIRQSHLESEQKYLVPQRSVSYDGDQPGGASPLHAALAGS